MKKCFKDWSQSNKKALFESKQKMAGMIRISQDIDWLQSLKHYFIDVSFLILGASLTLMAIRVRLAPSIRNDILMKTCFKDWSQSCQNRDLRSATFTYMYFQICD